MHLLLADSDAGRRLALRDALRAHGHTVTEADCAVSAFLTVEHGAPAVQAVVIAESLLITGGMPTGRKTEFSWSTVLHVRYELPSVPILLLLDVDDAHTRERAFAAKAEVVVHGPACAVDIHEWLSSSPKPRRNVLRAGDLPNAFT